jgi:hypothetical protein
VNEKSASNNDEGSDFPKDPRPAGPFTHTVATVQSAYASLREEVKPTGPVLQED